MSTDRSLANGQGAKVIHFKQQFISERSASMVTKT
jgi:hypothetical protein